jgi:peptidoglycan pentaglycine glycine transferase (the first glycine)
MDWSDALLRMRVLSDLQSMAKKQSAVFLKIDPDVVLGTGIPQRSPTSPDVDQIVVTTGRP